jgi:hypothetical protein
MLPVVLGNLGADFIHCIVSQEVLAKTLRIFFFPFQIIE